MVKEKNTKKEVKEKDKNDKRDFRRGNSKGGFRRGFTRKRFEEVKEWIPKTVLGKKVLKGNYSNVDEILEKGELILEPEIIDHLIPDLKQEVIYIGGTPGKGGGIKRTATKKTSRMHKSGRRFKLTAVIVVGNENGIVGIGKASSREHRIAIEKAAKQAKLNVVRVRRSCGSWECACPGNHSIPFETTAKIGSVRAVLKPAPKGVGIVADGATKKILQLSGIKDIWVKTYGATATRMNLAFAVFTALKNLNRTKGSL
ncbi:MAG: 30S ribosomal protein S5 [Nanoarchaeota archaeon]|nr:30S ribosomal protein S5 [Nanoarchaeota archaeon]MBU1135295.1 30S ribosomal protein S5 [Nanoarchaeota archaeon]MBU2520285.1 30S ribosomal protein S5 [Nanoarchaeota archaeon]